MYVERTKVFEQFVIKVIYMMHFPFRIDAALMHISCKMNKNTKTRNVEEQTFGMFLVPKEDNMGFAIYEKITF